MIRKGIPQVNNHPTPPQPRSMFCLRLEPRLLFDEKDQFIFIFVFVSFRFIVSVSIIDYRLSFLVSVSFSFCILLFFLHFAF